jgi:membrane-bound lytic murein transglycosylase B
MKPILWVTMMFCALTVLPASAADPVQDYATRDDVIDWALDFSTRSGINHAWIMETLSLAQKQDAVITLMDAPYVAPPPWYEYAPRFLNTGRRDQGVAFWNTHEKTLARAKRYFGVPPEIVVAIIGIETYYGRQTGKYRLLDTLTTLAFDYPRRSLYFKSELEAFFLMTRDFGFAPTDLKGSYAGAMGLPQFMPNSYRNFALDFDQNHAVNLWESTDAIGSVAYYLKEHGWNDQMPVMREVTLTNEVLSGLGTIDFTEFKPWREWQAIGVALPTSQETLPPDTMVALFSLEVAANQTKYYLAFPSFQALLRYNKSKRYAAAVTLLAAEIRAQKAIKKAPKKKPKKASKKPAQ